MQDHITFMLLPLSNYHWQSSASLVHSLPKLYLRLLSYNSQWAWKEQRHYWLMLHSIQQFNTKNITMRFNNRTEYYNDKSFSREIITAENQRQIWFGCTVELRNHWPKNFKISTKWTEVKGSKMSMEWLDVEYLAAGGVWSLYCSLFKLLNGCFILF